MASYTTIRALEDAIATGVAAPASFATIPEAEAEIAARSASPVPTITVAQNWPGSTLGIYSPDAGEWYEDGVATGDTSNTYYPAAGSVGVEITRVNGAGPSVGVTIDRVRGIYRGSTARLITLNGDGAPISAAGTAVVLVSYEGGVSTVDRFYAHRRATGSGGSRKGFYIGYDTSTGELRSNWWAAAYAADLVLPITAPTGFSTGTTFYCGVRWDGTDVDIWYVDAGGTIQTATGTLSSSIATINAAASCWSDVQDSSYVGPSEGFLEAVEVNYWASDATLEAMHAAGPAGIDAIFDGGGFVRGLRPNISTMVEGDACLSSTIEEAADWNNTPTDYGTDDLLAGGFNVAAI